MNNCEMIKPSPEQVTLPPVRLATIVVLVDEVFAWFFPDEKEHGEAHTRETQDEEAERTASENTVDSWHVEQEYEEDCLSEDSEEHVFVEAGIN